MKSPVAIVEWYGPYSRDNARDAASDFTDGVYLALGKCKYERPLSLQYIGLALDLQSRINGAHHKLSRITREFSLWFGEVSSPRAPGKKTKFTDRILDLSEWAHAYFLQLPLNDRKKMNPPDLPITVYNRWWRTDYETQYMRRPHREWPDVIDYLGDEYNAKLVWFGGQQVVQSVNAFKN